MRNALLTGVLVLAVIAAVLYLQGSTVRVLRSGQRAWMARVDSVQVQNAKAQRTIDSLLVVIAAERALRARLDSMDRAVVTDPRYRLGAYRDSTIEAKLEFILGLR